MLHEFQNLFSLFFPNIMKKIRNLSKQTPCIVSYWSFITADFFIQLYPNRLITFLLMFLNNTGKWYHCKCRDNPQFTTPSVQLWKYKLFCENILHRKPVLQLVPRRIFSSVSVSSPLHFTSTNPTFPLGDYFLLTN